MKERDGGRSRLILKTLGSIRSLCPVPEFSCLDLDESVVDVFWRDFDTRPGTDDLRISSSSFCSAFISDDFSSTSESLNNFCIIYLLASPKEHIIIKLHTFVLSLLLDVCVYLSSEILD